MINGRDARPPPMLFRHPSRRLEWAVMSYVRLSRPRECLLSSPLSSGGAGLHFDPSLP